MICEAVITHTDPTGMLDMQWAMSNGEAGNTTARHIVLGLLTAEKDDNTRMIITGESPRQLDERFWDGRRISGQTSCEQPAQRAGAALWTSLWSRLLRRLTAVLVDRC